MIDVVVKMCEDEKVRQLIINKKNMNNNFFFIKEKFSKKNDNLELIKVKIVWKTAETTKN